MLKHRINVVLFGIGNIGGTLLKQVLESQNFFLEKRNIDLHFPIITNSRLVFFEKEGITNHWESNFTQFAVPFSIDDVIKYVKANELENLIAIDATASQEFVKNYIPLIEAGFNIVAANKKANSIDQDFYNTLRNKLQQYNKSFLYETNVGAGLPVIKTIRDLYYSGDKITKIRGVFSGSLSYIFNRFSSEESDFSSILIEAEKVGYTEPDSREDLSGNDVARKLLILARELEQKVEFQDIKISSLLLPNLNHENTKAEYSLNKSLFDKPFKIAKLTQSENHVLRYIGEIDLTTATIEVKLVSEPKNSPLGQLKGADNSIEIYTKTYGDIPIVIQGAGAGKEVTARGVLADLLIIAEQIKNKETILS